MKAGKIEGGKQVTLVSFLGGSCCDSSLDVLAEGSRPCALFVKGPSKDRLQRLPTMYAPSMLSVSGTRTRTSLLRLDILIFVRVSYLHIPSLLLPFV